MNAIEIKGLSKSFRGLFAVNDLNMTVPVGSIYGFIGENGAGKSTFLRILCGELEPTRGEVYIPDTVRMSVLKQDHFMFTSASTGNKTNLNSATNADIPDPEEQGTSSRWRKPPQHKERSP